MNYNSKNKFRPFFKLVYGGILASILFTPVAESANLSLKPKTSLENQLQTFSKHGKVVYDCEGKSPDTLYIIGISHRDSKTLKKGAPDSQEDIYKIGEWLIKNKDLDILFPEGYFNSKTKNINLGTENKINNNYIAERELNKVYGTKLIQIENFELFKKVEKQVNNFEKSKNPYEKLFEKSKLDNLQENRVANMIQEIPKIMKREIQNKKKTTMFTIGLNHLKDIIKWLNEGKIDIRAPTFTYLENKKFKMNLCGENDLSVKVIVPNSLLDIYYTNFLK